MNLSNPARAMLQRVPGLNGALDKILARLNALWDVQHTDDGGHKAITGESLTVTGTVTADGTETHTFGGSGTFAGNVTGDGVQVGTVGTSAGAVSDIGSGIDFGEWRFIEGTRMGGPPNRSLGLYDVGNGGQLPFMFWCDGTEYYLSPHGTTNSTDPVNIGDDFQSFGSGRFANGWFTAVHAGSAKWRSGTGTPESAVTGNVGDLFTRTDGGAVTTLYVKESGTGNTGWVAK